MTLQEHYNSIVGGKGNKAQFLKQARHLFPQHITNLLDFDTTVNVLKSKQIISEAITGGVVGKGFDIYNWKKILAEETKSVEKETSKEVEDYRKNTYDNADMKKADNINFNEIMKGFYLELKNSKNHDKTVDELKDIVIKNLAKDALYYTKGGMFGVEGLGYTDEAPGLGKNTQPTSKEASVLGGRDEVNSDSDIVKNSLVGSAKKNVKDTLSNSEAKTSMPKKVKEMPDKGVEGVEKKIKLKEGIHDKNILSRPLSNPEIKYKETSPEEEEKLLDKRSESILRMKYREQINNPSITDDELRYILSGKGVPGLGGRPNAVEKIINDRAEKNISEDEKNPSLKKNKEKSTSNKQPDYGFEIHNPKTIDLTIKSAGITKKEYDSLHPETKIILVKNALSKLKESVNENESIYQQLEDLQDELMYETDPERKKEIEAKIQALEAGLSESKLRSLIAKLIKEELNGFDNWKKQLYNLVMNKANLDADEIAIDDTEIEKYYNEGKTPSEVYFDIWLQDAGNFYKVPFE